MRPLLACCPHLPCGIWHASFSSAQSAAVVKNNSMGECFKIFLGVTELAPPMSRRPVANRREWLLPVLMPDRYQTGIVFDPCAPANPTKTINGKVGEPPEVWTRHTSHCRPTKPTEGAISELIAGNHLLARLMFQRIRSRTPGMISAQSCFPNALQPTRASIASLDITMPFVDCADASARAPIPPEIETLFTQLARRRIRSGATQETP